MTYQVIEVPVSADHILYGEQYEPCACALALAIRDLFPDEVYVSVSTKTVVVGIHPNRRNYLLRDDAKELVKKYDRSAIEGMGSINPCIVHMQQCEDLVLAD